MTTPVRIQRQRTKGWRMPEGAVYVGRPSLFGNPWTAGEAWGMWPDPTPRKRAEWAVEQYRAELLSFGLMSDWGAVVSEARWLAMDALITEHRFGSSAELFRHLLRDATALACWCPLDQPCHADVLIEVLNR